MRNCIGGSPKQQPPDGARKLEGLFASADIPTRLHADMLHYLWIQYAITGGLWAALISVRECRDVSILDLVGRSTIDGEQSELLSRHLRDLTASGKRKLLLNLMNLSQIDSSGVSIIVEMYVSLKRTGGELKLLSPRGRVLDVLKVFRLLDVIPSFEDETNALVSFRPRTCSATY